MPELSHIDPGSAALLVMDYQVDTLTRFMTAAQSADAHAPPMSRGDGRKDSADRLPPPQAAGMSRHSAA
jgi:hypothetical protein